MKIVSVERHGNDWIVETRHWFLGLIPYKMCWTGLMRFDGIKHELAWYCIYPHTGHAKPRASRALSRAVARSGNGQGVVPVGEK